MIEPDFIEAANQITMQRLLERYFSKTGRYATCEIAGAVVTVEPSRHRTGIPDDATCARYIVTHPVEGWSLAARAVWRNGSLFQPAAVHTTIDDYFDNEGRHNNNPVTLAKTANDWFRLLCL